MNNNLRGTLSNENLVDAEHVKCTGCGANMVFNPERKALYCEHCGNVYEFANGNTASENDLLAGFSADNNWSESEVNVFSCENCGTKVVLNKSEVATVCPFCGTHHVKESSDLAGVKPHGLIPFDFSTEKAIELSKNWARKKFYAPRKFKKNLNSDNVKGVYTPCFTFDSHTVSYYEGRVGVRHTRVVGSGKNRRTETYIVWRRISGVYTYSFDDVLVTAGSKFNQQNLDKVAPFNTNNSAQYDQKYMLGFMAYHYDYDLTSCWGEAKNRIDGVIRNNILSGHRHDVVDYLNVSTNHERVTFKYVMLPVYVGAFNYKSKLYNFFINGSTGKVTGKTPKSFIKILLTVLFGVAMAGILCFLFYYLLN